MGWDFLSDQIRNKIEKIKRTQGYITTRQLDANIEDIFLRLQSSDFFLDEFEGVDEQTLSIWLAKIKLRLKSIIVTTIEHDTIIDENDYERWIDKRSLPVAWNYFERYVAHLRKIGRPVDVIASTEKSTKAIIERLGDPRKYIPALQKGLVLGSVQSGKTANFNGVINRAIDVGYDMIIIFSGIMEDLRSQTQRRINSEVIGIGEYGNQINQPIGVGIIQQFGKDSVYQVTSITSTGGDFKKSMVEFNFDFTNPKILVCKKNVGVLTNLIYWLKSSLQATSAKLSKSLLVIDDEADNASLNNLGHKGADYSSKVNGNLRALLDLFERRSYLGYTATPFGNILQDQHGGNESPNAWTIKYRLNGQVHELNCSLAPSLFPDKFIYKLAAPSSYLGPKRFFSNGRENETDKKLPLIEIIPPATEDKDYVFEGGGLALKKSLIDAIDCFILSIALRDSRKPILQCLPGFTDHHTMLVHISRLIDDQNEIADTIRKYIEDISARIGSDSLSDPEGIYERLKLQWNRFFAYKVANIHSYLPDGYNSDGLDVKTWDEISAFIPNAIKGVMVRAINSKTGDKLTYPDGGNHKYIAVGGNRLSRGFTLEGLTINYFLRNTSYYDALLQMGRWFGYRPGYIDACRLFIDFETEKKYDFITAALTELEEQVDIMSDFQKTPKEFELRIKKHPDVLKITRASILKNAKEVKLSFQNHVEQSTKFTIKKQRIEESWNAFYSLFSELEFKEGEGFYTIETDKATLYRFLNLPATFSPASIMKDSVIEYIEKCSEIGKLNRWKVAIKRTGSANRFAKEGFSVHNLIKRRAPSEKEEPEYYKELLEEQIFTASGKSRNIITSGKDEAIGLSEEQIEKAEGQFRMLRAKKYETELGMDPDKAKEEASKITIPGYVYRAMRQEKSEGLLLIYLIDQKIIFNQDSKLKTMADAQGIDREFPLIGYALSFPPIKDDPGGIYMANDIVEPDEEMDDIYNDDEEMPDDIYNDINDIE